LNSPSFLLVPTGLESAFGRCALCRRGPWWNYRGCS